MYVVQALQDSTCFARELLSQTWVAAEIKLPLERHPQNLNPKSHALSNRYNPYTGCSLEVPLAATQEPYNGGACSGFKPLQALPS